jgi:hypothetical protein
VAAATGSPAAVVASLATAVLLAVDLAAATTSVDAASEEALSSVAWRSALSRPLHTATGTTMNPTITAMAPTAMAPIVT